MFEKEAEEWVKENMDCCRTDNSVNHPIPYFDEEERCCAKSAFIDGAELGYNKANEWHYVKDGVYPTDDKKVLCILGDFENDNLEVGYCSQVEGDSKRWRFEDYDLPDDSEEGWGVSAWKEIVLPELKESE